MTTTLTQSAAASFPDRGNTGLLVSFDGSTDGSYLAHNLATQRDTLHVRLLFSPGTAEGGSVQIAGMCDALGQPVWWLNYNADSRQLTLALTAGGQLTTTLNPLEWQCIEVRCDHTTASVQWWINGIDAGSTTSIAGELRTQHAWLGGAFPSSSLTGEIMLDDWALADTYIGPIVVPPTSDFADDPACWLVVYNTAGGDGDDAARWAQAYRQARHIPYANLLGIDLPEAEQITASEYAQLDADIESYLQSTGLDAQVMGILLGYRVPGYVDFAGYGDLDAVPAMLSRSGPGSSPYINTNASDTLPSRPTRATLGNDRLTARIDSPTLDDAIALISRATTLRDTPLNSADNATLWFDPFAGDNPNYASAIEQMLAWSQSIDRMRCHLPMELNGDEENPTQQASFTQIHNDGFYWGWSGASPGANFFAAPAGKRIFSAQFHLESPTATTLRSASASNWIDLPISAGYAAAAASSKVYSASALPYARPFFEAIRQVWTLAEAWYLALPVLREGLYLVGDPLLQVQLPKAGWEVFSPVSQLEQLDPYAPARVLRDNETSLALPDEMKLAPQSQGYYLVRHIDEQGRSEAGLSVVHRGEDQGAAAVLPTPPVWPDFAGWRVSAEQGGLVFTLAWDRPISACHVQQVHLMGEVDYASEMVLVELAIDPRKSVLQTQLPWPSVSGRYRWRITSPANQTWVSPWSQTALPTYQNSTLQVLEVLP